MSRVASRRSAGVSARAFLRKQLLSSGFKPVLNALYYSGLYRLLARNWSGVGAIFTLHHVTPGAAESEFSPNGILHVTPEFLDGTLALVRDLGYDLVSLDELCRRLKAREFSRRFVCFTLDDGYLDNFEQALPIFEKHEAPFAVYVATSFPDGEALLWWEILEQVIADSDSLSIDLDDGRREFDTGTSARKQAAWNSIYAVMRTMPEDEQRDLARDLAERQGIDTRQQASRTSMSWDQLKTLAAHELATIGAHTVNHFSLRKLPEARVREEVSVSREILTQRLDTEIRHFSYPYGDPGSAGAREFGVVRELGFDSATTTRKAMLFPEHRDHLHALPRVSLNGNYQAHHFTRLFLSGAPFALSNRFNRLVVD